MVRPFHIFPRSDGLLLFLGEPGYASVDLSKATNLEGVVFRPQPRMVEWVTTALHTITSEHRDLREISIRLPYCLTLDRASTIRQAIAGAGSDLWLNLDCLLVQFWESHSIRPMIVYTANTGITRDHIECLLPEITKRGVIDIFEY
jgi:hypothetical protein